MSIKVKVGLTSNANPDAMQCLKSVGICTINQRERDLGPLKKSQSPCHKEYHLRCVMKIYTCTKLWSVYLVNYISFVVIAISTHSLSWSAVVVKSDLFIFLLLLLCVYFYCIFVFKGYCVNISSFLFTVLHMSESCLEYWLVCHLWHKDYQDMHIYIKEMSRFIREYINSHYLAVQVRVWIHIICGQWLQRSLCKWNYATNLLSPDDYNSHIDWHYSLSYVTKRIQLEKVQQNCILVSSSNN